MARLIARLRVAGRCDALPSLLLARSSSSAGALGRLGGEGEACTEIPYRQAISQSGIERLPCSSISGNSIYKRYYGAVSHQRIVDAPDTVAVDVAANNADQLAEIVTKCVTDGLHQPALLRQLAEATLLKKNELTAQNIADITVSFAKAGYFNSHFNTAMAGAIVESMAAFEPRQVADIAWSFGELEFYDYGLMTALLPYLEQHTDRFNASDFAKLLWAFGRLGFRNEAVMQVAHNIGQKLSSNCDAASMAEVVFAEARMGWGDEAVHNLVAEYAVEHIADFTPESLGKLAYGLACNGNDDVDVFKAITQRATAILNSLKPKDLGRILWACGELGYYDKAFLDAVAERLAVPNQVETFSSQELMTAVAAFNKLGFSAPGAASAALHLTSVLPHMNRRDGEGGHTPILGDPVPAV